MKNLANYNSGKLLGEQSPAIHHYQELRFAKIHGEAHGYQEHFGAGREASLV